MQHHATSDHTIAPLSARKAHFSDPVRSDSRCFLVEGDSEVECDGPGMRDVLVVGDVVADVVADPEPATLFLLLLLPVLPIRACPLILTKS